MVLGKGAKILIRESAQGTCLPHHCRRRWRPREWKKKMEEMMDSKEWKEQSRKIKTSQCRCDINTRKCDMWRVLFTHPVGCSRLLSSVNDLTTTKKSCQSEEPSSISRPLLWCRSFLELRRNWLWWIFELYQWSSTATTMCWMKKTADAISETGREGSMQVALLQTHGEDGASLLMLRWSLIGVSSLHFCQMCSER